MRPRVLTAPLGRWVDPEQAYRAVVGDAPDAFWLDSGPGATAGMSWLGTGTPVPLDDDAAVLPALRAELGGVDTVDAPPGFALGLVGWLGYELHAETMGTVTGRLPAQPGAAWLRVDRALAFDHTAREVTLLALGQEWTGELLEWRKAVTAALGVPAPEPAEGPDPARPLPSTSSGSGVSATWAYTDEQYLDMIARCQQHIRNGDAYQLCLTTQVRVEARPDPVATYRLLRAASPTHHGALLRISGTALLSSSPERFLEVTPDGVVRTSPIKGTRRRDPEPVADAALAAELLASEKERAENLMIVDLMRNDFSRVCELGSVEVSSLLQVESYAQVHQLVSTVRGRLAAGLDGIDAIAACFPAGSMTGAPKRSAVELLDAIEQRPRGIYSGVFGYLGFDGAVDLGMVIRSIVIDASGCTIGTGGGITALSVPEEELEETRVKARALLSVLGAVAG